MHPTTGCWLSLGILVVKHFQDDHVYEATTANIYIGESLQEYSLQVNCNTDYLYDVNPRPLNVQDTTY